MPFMTRIPSDLARFGLRVELVPGWETRGSSAFAPAAVTCHWTAGPKNAADKSRPSLNVVVNGRPGIPGPLCNIYLARDGTCVIVAAGRANHAGVGGFRGLVGNSAVYGIEAESGGDGDWTKAQNKVYPILVAALLSGIGRDASWAHGHHEWAPSRKIDIRDIMPTVRAEAARVLANGGPPPADPIPQEDDMRLIQAPNRGIAVIGPGYYRHLNAEEAANAVAIAGPAVGGNDRQFDLWRSIALSGVTTSATAVQLNEAVATLAGIDGADVDEDTLAAALAPRLNGTSMEAIAEAVRGVLRDGVGSTT